MRLGHVCMDQIGSKSPHEPSQAKDITEKRRRVADGEKDRRCYRSRRKIPLPHGAPDDVARDARRRRCPGKFAGFRRHQVTAAAPAAYSSRSLRECSAPPRWRAQ